jgi:hypothetical protein
MPLDIARCRQQLKQFNLQPLFVEQLGWDRHVQRLDVTLDGQTFTLAALAHKRGMVAFFHQGKLPDYPTRRKIERQVAKNVHEHLLIFADPQRTTQIWQWVKREPGKPLACREHSLHRDQPGDALIQKLQALAFSIEEEESVTIVDVTSRVRAGFDVERVTKRFYDTFKDEHATFLDFIKGIPDDELHRWYASVMLNRLMFVYFIQKKGFLNSDPDYLRNKLAQTKGEGQNRFYAAFLCPLFFEGFAKKAKNRSADTNKLLGKVPYLNGGIFQRHQIEELHGETIKVADAAFEKLFDFFDQYQWHLDERPLRRDNEINPDVLGYIFEKYINQKQMGAYYTKEDITDYNGKYTIVPFLFEIARAKCKVAFEGENSVWKLLQADPDRYIYPAVKKGVELKLPTEIAAGIKDVSKRAEWNKPTPAEHALPTEIWREVVARRERYEEIRKKLAAGEIADINDFITYNLDIRQFAQDVIENSEPDLLSAIYDALLAITVLDPTCGSGAFLFAALNILYPLYEACLNRIALFVEEWERTGSKAHPNYSKNFKAELARLAAHQNEPYFILKTIIVNNLYGVDIMDEAVEICKLRLFLKLVAQVESADDVEPLPDIDFNIRAGNTLVGYASADEVRKAITTESTKGGEQAKLLLGDAAEVYRKFEENVELVDRAFQMFRRQQTELGGEVTAADKRDLRKRLETLEAELNRYLATAYGVDVTKPAALAKWQHSHKPFHWFIEFYGIMKHGGFDVIIGNPPWIEYAKVRKEYTVHNYLTEGSGNLYALCTERSLRIRSPHGALSFIVQLPLSSSSRMESARRLLREQSRHLYVITFGDRPGKLFDGLEHSRSVIFISHSQPGKEASLLATTRFQRWPTETRPYLFERIEYTPVAAGLLYENAFPKYATPLQESVFAKVKAKGTQFVEVWLSRVATKHFIFYQEATEYWVKATVGLPYYAKNGKVGAPAHGRYLYFDRADVSCVTCSMLNSSLFFIYFVAYGDCFHLSDTLVSGFRAPPSLLEDHRLVTLGQRLMKELRAKAERKTITTKDEDKIAYDEFYGWKSKPVIDEIDRVLAGHYGLTAEELDFIINYDIKYRLGLDAGEEENE